MLPFGNRQLTLPVQWGDRFDPERPRVPHHAKAARCKKLMKMVNEFTDETGATLARLFFKGNVPSARPPRLIYS